MGVESSAVEKVADQLFTDENLNSDKTLKVRRATISDIESLTLLYQQAHARGDWFGGRAQGRGDRKSVSELLESLLIDQSIIYVKFVGTDGELLGATMLEYEAPFGMLIDETQIHPVRGRRKGIMTKYFRRLVPVLDNVCRYRTEFVVVPEARVLRRILISEFGMVPLGFFPNYYRARKGGLIANLVAYGPSSEVLAEISDIRPCSGQAKSYFDAVLGRKSAGVTPIREGKVSSSEFSEEKVPLSEEVEELGQVGKRIVGFIPYERKYILASWPSYGEQNLGFVYEEGIEAVSRLVEFVIS